MCGIGGIISEEPIAGSVDPVIAGMRDLLRHQGFIFPFREWLAKGAGGDFISQETPGSGSKGPWYRRWSLFVLQSWWKGFS